MKPSIRLATLLGMLGIFLSLAQVGFADTIALGKLEFKVDTSIRMFRFKGHADQLQGTLTRKGDQLKTLDLSVPVNSLHTGMSMRDHHMRERIFTTPDGKTPDVVFKASNVKCDAKCQITGTLTIRGQTRPQLIDLTMKDPTHVDGTATVLLSKFGIADPEEAGVKVADAVKLSFDVTLKK